MDWLEEKTEQFKKYLQNASMIKSLLGYLLVAMISVLVCFIFTRNLCMGWISVLLERCPEGKNVNVEHFLTETAISIKSQLLINIVRTCYNSCLYLYILIAFIAVGTLYFKRKIRPAVDAITESMNYIASGDFSHEISYRSEDEMGKMCEEFERMRKRLILDKQRQWDLQEEQRKINAAFAHDVRTPLTVIKGYTEFLRKYVPLGKISEEMLLEKLETIHNQEERLFEFTKTMSKIQNIEKREVVCNWKRYGELLKQINAVIQGLEKVGNKRITFETGEQAKEVFADYDLVLEVFDNILSNAIRYSKFLIEVKVKLSDKELIIFVKDDGKGFSNKALREASNIYFSEEDNTRDHFGIGLSICKMLCEKHGGNMTLMNSIERGAIVCTKFYIGVR
jgi:signal transduction histidine kinase